MADRQVIRQFINSLGPSLNRSQANGTLARTKLDVRDQFEGSIASEDEPTRAKSLSTFNEEMEAFCTDMRLAGVTVQQQVERHTFRWGRGFLFAFLGAAACFIVGMVMAGTGSTTLGPVLVLLGTPFAFITFLIIGGKPEV